MAAVCKILLFMIACFRDCVLTLGSFPTISEGQDEVRVTPGDDLGLSVLELNRVTFKRFVLDIKSNPYVDHIFVQFCISWWQPCKKIASGYTSLAIDVQERSNKDLMRSKVRFAYVDCATDKELCNRMDQDLFPSIVHYSKNVLARPLSRSALSTWHSSDKSDQSSLEHWIDAILDDHDTIITSRSAYFPILQEYLGLEDVAQAYSTAMEFTRALFAGVARNTDMLMYIDTEGDNVTMYRHGADVIVLFNGQPSRHDMLHFDREKGILFLHSSTNGTIETDIPMDSYDTAQLLLDAATAHKWIELLTEWIDKYEIALEIFCVVFFCVVLGVLRYARKRSMLAQQAAQRKQLELLAAADNFMQRNAQQFSERDA